MNGGVEVASTNSCEARSRTTGRVVMIAILQLLRCCCGEAAASWVADWLSHRVVRRYQPSSSRPLSLSDRASTSGADRLLLFPAEDHRSTCALESANTPGWNASHVASQQIRWDGTRDLDSIRFRPSGSRAAFCPR